MMNTKIEFTLKSIVFYENYQPSDNTRITTNFANLARGARCRENLIDTKRMINNRFNNLIHWDNPNADRYSIRLEIVSVDIDVEGNGSTFPSIEILKTNILDHKTGQVIEGIVGNNLSSYVRDYDFSVFLLNHNKDLEEFSVPEDFGDLHGKIFKYFVSSKYYKEHFNKPPVICLSVSDKKTYHGTENRHPVLGLEYQPEGVSLTECYFRKMGLQVRYFMPANSTAPFAFYFFGDLLNDYTNLELASTISTMETFQKIYRPEIYNANTIAGKVFRPSLGHQDYSVTRIDYDREERSQLAIKQGRFAEEHFIKPYQKLLEQWSAEYVL